MIFEFRVGPPDKKLQHMGDGARNFGAVRIPLIISVILPRADNGKNHPSLDVQWGWLI